MESSTATRDDPGEPRSTWQMACSKSGHEESKRNWLPKRFRSVSRRLIFNEYFSRLSSGRPVRTHESAGVRRYAPGTLKPGGYLQKTLNWAEPRNCWRLGWGDRGWGDRGADFSALVITSRQRKGRIRSAERTEVHLIATILFHELTFCP